MTPYSVVAERAGFWRHLIAFSLDGLIVALVLEIVAILAYPMSNGHVQWQGQPLIAGMQTATCTSKGSVPSGIAPPASFQPNSVSECMSDIFGHTIGHYLVLSDETKAERKFGLVDIKTVTAQSVQYALDRNSNRIVALNLSDLLLPLLIGFRALFDLSSLGTPGRRLAGLRVVHADGPGGGRSSKKAIALRYCLFGAPLIPLLLLGAACPRSQLPSA